MPCGFSVCLQGVPGFLRRSDETSLGVCEILGNPLLKSERCLWSLSVSSRASGLCSSASKRLQISFINACFLLSCFSLKTSTLWNYLILWSPCRLNAHVEFCWQAWNLSKRMLHAYSLSLCPSFAPWRSQCDANIWSEVIPWCQVASW